MKYGGLVLFAVLTGAALSNAGQPAAAKTARGITLDLPGHWSLTPLMAPTNTLGLRIYSYLIDEAEQDVLRWRGRYMANCRLPSVNQDDDDWHCIDANHIYSLLWRHEGFIWVHSERLGLETANTADGLLQNRLRDIDATVLSHSETAFESVTLLHSRRSLYALTQDLQRRHEQDGGRLLVAEKNVGGFIQQWQVHHTRVTYTAQRDEQGDVLLVKVRGTNL